MAQKGAVGELPAFKMGASGDSAARTFALDAGEHREQLGQQLHFVERDQTTQTFERERRVGESQTV